MKLYVHAISSFRSDREILDIKKELKQKYKVDIRRKEEFIFAGLLGAMRLKENISFLEDSELYITSGYGNIEILSKMNNYILEEGDNIKLFDFINMLGNTTNFYVAKALDIKGKSIFCISDEFTYFHMLITLYVSLLKRNNDAIVGAIDVVPKNPEVIKRVANIDNDIDVITSVMFQKMSLNPINALCCLEFDTKFYTFEEIQEYIQMTSLKIYTSMRCQEIQRQTKSYFETDISCIVNDSILNKEDCCYIECYNSRYKILKIMSQ